MEQRCTSLRIARAEATSTSSLQFGRGCDRDRRCRLNESVDRFQVEIVLDEGPHSIQAFAPARSHVLTSRARPRSLDPGPVCEVRRVHVPDGDADASSVLDRGLRDCRVPHCLRCAGLSVPKSTRCSIVRTRRRCVVVRTRPQ
jgi:hypothetical protein